MSYPKNLGTPLLYHKGTDDQSGNQIEREALGQPQHLPKFFVFGEKGDLEPHLCGGAERNLLYGSETFNPRSKFSTHSTPFQNIINRNGNQCIYQRLVPPDATVANVTLWLDVVAEDIPVYERLDDGSFETDSAGDFVPTGATTPGYKAKWVSSFEPDKNALIADFSAKHQKPGSLTNDAGDVSVMYPVADFLYNGEGEKGNNAGIRIWAPTARSDVYNFTLPETLRVFPYFLSVMERAQKNYSYRSQSTVLGEKEVSFSLKKGLENDDTGQPLYLGDVFIKSYSTTNDSRYLPVHGDFSKTYIYDDSIEDLVAMFHGAEVPFIADYASDFTEDPEDRHLFNLVSGVTLGNVPYSSFQLIDEADSVRLTKYTTIPTEGGQDGDLSIEMYDQLCEVEFTRYSDPMDEAQDMAAFFEGDLYDSGFRISTKFAMIDAISLRPDLMIYLTPHVYKNPVLNRAEELGVMIALMSRIEAYPESVYFGTPTMRALVLPGTGKIRNNLFRDDVPLLIELADKMSKMMGASNSNWKESAGFDSMPGSAIDITTDINYSYMPVASRQLYYDTGLNWVHRYQRDIFAFPVLKTVQRNPTSVLNSLMMAKAICWVNKVVDVAWRHFCGNVKLEGPQLIARINEYISNRANRKVFAGYVEVIPRTEITEKDKLRNFSITVPVEVYGNSPLTVVDTYVISRNLRDLNNVL